MPGENVCPFFRKNEDFCDVGCGYISPHDVKVMVTHCNSRYLACARYQLLASRVPEPADPPLVIRHPGSQEHQPGRGTGMLAKTPSEQPPEVAPFKVKWPLPYQMRYMSMYHSDSSIQAKERIVMTEKASQSNGWIVVLAGLCINLALGILYTWSIFKGAIAESIAAGGPFTWDKASINDPYAVCCLVFAASMILAGKCQDRFGPRVTIMIGGLLVGAGFLTISQSTSYWAWVAGFGALAGMGIGFAYSAATPPALKWFPTKTGLIAGIVVSGFGLASLYIAPLATYMLGIYGLQKSMMIFGIAFAIVVCGLGMLVKNPPAGFIAAAPAQKAGAPKPAAVVDLSPSQLFTQGKFYTLWLCYFIGAGAGLMVIGSAKGLAKASMGEMAFLVVAIMSIGNAAGRLVAGVVSDKIGRANTLTIMLLFQAALMFAAIPGLLGESANPVVVVLLVTFMVFNYGTNLALFPSFTKDLWGLKNFGMNYGILFSAWGVGAFVLVRVSEMLRVKTGSFATPFVAAGVLLLIGAVFALSLRPKKVAVEAEAPAAAYDEEELVVQKAD